MDAQALRDLADALAADIHSTFCERSAVAVRRMTPQETAHQVEGLVRDRILALAASIAAHGDAEGRA